jgi:hypothetical protein
MSDFWLNVLGLAIAGGLVIFLLVRLVKAWVTRDFYLGGGIHFRQDEQPQKYVYFMVCQVIGSILVVWLYGMLLWNKFVIDTDWMSR